MVAYIVLFVYIFVYIYDICVIQHNHGSSGKGNQAQKIVLNWVFDRPMTIIIATSGSGSTVAPMLYIVEGSDLPFCVQPTRILIRSCDSTNSI
jgi:hypothetical protein